MPCFHPITAFQPLEGGALTFRELPDHRQLEIPCNQCVGCRLRRSAEWATRCMHEAKMHRHNTWATLTYDDEHLPSRYHTGITHPRTKKPILSGTLVKEHPQKFFRALRKALLRKEYRGKHVSNGPLQFDHLNALTDTAYAALCRRKRGHAAFVRYYYGGEYGEQYGRPHYHACLFGIDFADKKHVSTTETGFKLYESKTLAELWPHGQHSIGELTWESAAYTARYIMKKITGDKQQKHYEKIDTETGEIIKTTPEFNDMSRRPGIGKLWIDKFRTDVYPRDYVLVNGRKTNPPRYYDKQHELDYPDELELIKFGRQIEAKLHAEDNTDQRLLTKEIVTIARTQSLKQKF